MGMLILEATGPRGEDLAIAAGEARGFAVGWDSEFESATFDVDGMDDGDLQELVFEELESRDSEWRSQLRLVD
jgi:hypothetical protein